MTYSIALSRMEIQVLGLFENNASQTLVFIG